MEQKKVSGSKQMRNKHFRRQNKNQNKIHKKSSKLEPLEGPRRAERILSKFLEPLYIRTSAGRADSVQVQFLEPLCIRTSEGRADSVQVQFLEPLCIRTLGGRADSVQVSLLFIFFLFSPPFLHPSISCRNIFKMLISM